MEKNTQKSYPQKGSEEDVGICPLPALYKLFSTIPYNRLDPRLDPLQPEDQGGFRESYQTLDHFVTYSLIEQNCQEWSVKIWLATNDFMKALIS